MQPEYSEQWQSPPQSQQQQQWQQAAVQRRQPQQQETQQQGAQQQSPQQPWQESVPPQWQQQPWPQQRQQPVAPQWQQQQVQQPWPQQPWQQQHQAGRPGRPGALWMLFGVALAIGFIEAAVGLLSPLILPTAIGAEAFGGRLIWLVLGLLLLGFAVCALVGPNAGRIGLVAVSGLALLDSLIGVPVVGIGNLSPLVAIPVMLWVVVPVLAFLPPVNRACRR